MAKAVFLDLSGVVYLGDEMVPGAIEAIRRLKAAGLPVRYVSNTTQISTQQVQDKLSTMGLNVKGEELFLPSHAARQYLQDHNLKPYLLTSDDLAVEFADLDGGEGQAVVVADAAEKFSYNALNKAFRLLMGGAPLLALARNRYYRNQDGELCMDAGPFVTALEHACGLDALVFGKPSPDFFLSAAGSVHCEVTDIVMVGDDAEADVAGAMALGMDGVLVRTGKYRRGAEAGVTPPPTAVVADVVEAVDWILKH